MTEVLNKWQSLSISIPPEIPEIGSDVASALHAVKSGIEVARTLAETASVLALSTDTPSVTALNALIRGAVSAIETAVNSLLDDTGVYMLVVPLPKKGLLSFIPPSREGGSTFLTSPTAGLLKELELNTAAEIRELPSWQRAFNPAMLFIGGNAWYLRVVSESLFDGGDVNRPKFGPESYWAYTMLIAGGQDLTSVMDAATFVKRLLGLGRDTHEITPDRSALSLVPQNVKVSLTGRENKICVTWDNVPASQIAASFDGTRIVPVSYAIIRCTDFQARNVRHAHELFPDGVTDGATGAFDARVMAVHNYDGVVSRWVDNTTTEPEQEFYYSVCFRVRVEPAQGDATLRPFDDLSSWSPIKIPRRQHIGASSGGTLPDWVRTPSVAQLVPSIGDFIDAVKEELNTLKASVNSANDRYTEVINFLSREAAKYTSKADALTRFVAQINAILSAPNAGLHAYIGTGKGPTGAFLADMTKAFDTSTDDGRPPYDLGSEYTTGVIFLSVGPDPSRVLKTLEAFKLLFSNAEQDPTIAAINQINTQLSHAANVIAASSTPNTFDAAMNPTTGPDAGCR